MPNPFTENPGNKADKPKGKNPKSEVKDRRGRPVRVDQGEDIAGTFDCQTCDEKVRGAVINPAGHLIWKCSQGHRSMIRNFV